MSNFFFTNNNFQPIDGDYFFFIHMISSETLIACLRNLTIINCAQLC